MAQDSLQIDTSSSNDLKTLLLRLESRSGYKVFFIDSWLTDLDFPPVDDSLSLPDYLDRLLAQTNLNFFILEDTRQVILLKNGMVYDQLPDNFFADDSIDAEDSNERTGINQPLAPVFVDGFYNRDPGQYPPIYIGKQRPGSQAAAFTLSGRVVNARTGEPLQDIPIRDESGTLLGLSSGEGQYRIRLPRGHTRISISGLGIQAMERDVIMYADGSLDLNMEEDVQQLEEVVVEADLRDNVEETVAGSEEINADESKNIPVVLGERDILQVARNLPGISTAGEGATGFNVRGGKADQNLVLLDDAVLYNPTHFFGIFQALNPFTTEGVTIYKGAMPVEYGGRISSVFDIRTGDGNTESLAAEGSIGPVTGNLAVEIPIKKDTSSLVAGARMAYADWILRSLDEESLNNSEASFYDFITHYNHQLSPEESLKATAYFSHDDFSITSDSLYRYNNALASIRWDKRLSERVGLAILLANSDYRFGIRYDGDANTDFNLDYGINQSQFKLKFTNSISENHVLDYGINANLYLVNPGSKEPRGGESAVETIRIDREKAADITLFAGDRFTVSDRLTLDYGARLTVFSALGAAEVRNYAEGQPKQQASVVSTDNYGNLEPIKTYFGPEFRFSARYLLAENLSAKIGANYSYQFLHTLSNNTTVSPIDTWKISDFHIAPQRGYQLTAGLFQNLDEDRWELSLEGYYKIMDDVLDFKTGANLFLNPNVETEILQGDGKAYGVEFLVRKSSGDLNGWLGYTYSRSLYRFDGVFPEERVNNGEFFPSNFDKPHDISLVANYRFTRRYSVSANFVYQTGRPVTYPVGTFRFNNADVVVYSDRNAFRIPDFYRLDLGVNIEGNHRKNKLAHSFWTISVYNVLGRNNPYSVFFVTENGEVKALQSSIFSIPVPSITYNFKF